LKNNKKKINRDLTEEEQSIKEYGKLLKEIESLEIEQLKLKILSLKAEIKKAEHEKEKQQQLKKQIEALKPFPDFFSKDEVLNNRDKLHSLFYSWQTLNISKEEKNKRLQQIENEISIEKQKLKEYKIVSQKSLADVEKLEIGAKELDKLKKEILNSEEFLYQKINALSNIFDIEQFEKMDSVFCKLEEKDKDILNNYESDLLKIKQNIEQLQKLKNYGKERDIIFMVGIILILIGLIFFRKHPVFFIILFLDLCSFGIAYYFHKKYKKFGISLNIKAKGLFKTWQLEEEIHKQKHKLEMLKNSVQRLLSRCNYRYEDYKKYIQFYHKFLEIKQYKENISKLKQRKEEIINEIEKIYSFDKEPDTKYIYIISNQIKEAIKIKDKIKEKEAILNTLKKEIQQEEKRIKEEEKRIKKLIEEIMGGMIEDLSIKEAVERAKELLKKAEKAYYLKEELKKLEKGIISEDKIIESKKQLESLQRDLKLEEILKEEPKEKPEFYLKKLNQVSEKLRELLNKKEKLTQKGRELLDSKEELYKIEKKLEHYKKHLKKAYLFYEAIKKAINILEEIIKTHYEQWAKRLNKDATKSFSSITNKNTEIEFDHKLSFILMKDDVKLTEEEIKEFLSGGALEQLYLAIRVALCKYISPKVNIPLLLDEPFAHADDKRFLQGMKYLLQEVALERQVIIFSCHRKRHEILKNILGEQGYELRFGI